MYLTQFPGLWLLATLCRYYPPRPVIEAFLARRWLPVTAIHPFV